MGADILAAILGAAFLQDLSYTSKTVLVSRGRRTLAVVADVFAMVASSLYLILTASVTIRSGFSIATVEAFAAIAAGGAGGTIAGMLAANWIERRFRSRRAERVLGDLDKSYADGANDSLWVGLTRTLAD